MVSLVDPRDAGFQCSSYKVEYPDGYTLEQLLKDVSGFSAARRDTVVEARVTLGLMDPAIRHDAEFDLSGNKVVAMMDTRVEPRSVLGLPVHAAYAVGGWGQMTYYVNLVQPPKTKHQD